MLLSALALWTPAQVPRPVEALLERAGKAPHNGYNPELVVPPAELAAARDGLEEAVRHGACAWARDAASLLTRLPERTARRAFWVEQLRNPDHVVRFFAVANVAEVANPADFEAVASLAVVSPDLRHPLSVRLRDFKDRRAVPILAELLDTPHADNAALSLSLMPGGAALEPDPTGPAKHVGPAWVQPTDRVAPYKRWWAEQGKRAFAAEVKWWEQFRARLKPDPALRGDGPCPTTARED